MFLARASAISGLGAAERAGLAGPGIAADQHRLALVARIERPHHHVGALAEAADGLLRVGDVPAEMPDRALRQGRRRGIDLVEQDHHVVRREQRLMSGPATLFRARELPDVKLDRRVGIDRIEVQVVKAGGRQSGGWGHRASPRISRTMPQPRRKAKFAGHPTSASTSSPCSDTGEHGAAKAGNAVTPSLAC